MTMELHQVVNDVVEAVVALDGCGIPFKQFQPGVGPLRRATARRRHREASKPAANVSECRANEEDAGPARAGEWALEFKIARPFGDNGKQAENWSVNLLHPYAGNVSVIGDCLKLQQLKAVERKAAVVVGYEHSPPQIRLAPLLDAFELVASRIADIRLGQRVCVEHSGLSHPVHQQVIVSAWEVL